MGRKVCKKCGIFVIGNKCPNCGGNNLSDSWSGRISMINHEKSEIAKKLEIKENGEYAIKVR
ncbi:MAG: DNA-directed RNA polymerase subunit E'' [Nanoarchaeota archaeon]|nr:DNA-directed RNA polymerase subunit E'' [Nanoarchaeota archaeon]